MLAWDKDCKDLGDGISDRKVFAENERHKRNVRKTEKRTGEAEKEIICNFATKKKKVPEI